jgi:zinc/manganese transport system substrate-binding protein
VAAENFWGSIAAQLGGQHVKVTSIVNDPNVDPHEYESNTENARAFSSADYVILNGAGYDDWGKKLLAANPESKRIIFSVDNLVGAKSGDNPHFWYNPDYVFKVIDQISTDYETLDPADAAYFKTQRASVLASMQPYLDRLGYIKTHFNRIPVAATENIFAYLADYTGLNLISPPEFMQAVSEGNDPPTQSVALFNQQIAASIPKVLVYNQQTANAVTTHIKEQAVSDNIPVVGLSETIQPPTATFQEWMNGQLDALIKALDAKVLSK